MKNPPVQGPGPSERSVGCTTDRSEGALELEGDFFNSPPGTHSHPPSHTPELSDAYCTIPVWETQQSDRTPRLDRIVIPDLPRHAT